MFIFIYFDCDDPFGFWENKTEFEKIKWIGVLKFHSSSVSRRYFIWACPLLFLFMELQLVEKALGFPGKRKNWVLLLAALGFTGYGAYRVFHLPSIARKRERVFKILGAFVSVAEAVSFSADSVGIISKDLKEFLQSDSDQIPNSLKQLSKIAWSNEFSESLVRVTQAVTLGVLRGYRSESRRNRDELGFNSNLTDQVLDKLFTKSGSGFASVVVGSFARNLIMAFFSDKSSDGSVSSRICSGFDHLGSESDPLPKWIDVVCSDKCREVIGDCIQMFVSSAVTVYLEKTMDINTYDEIFSGLTNPKHEAKVREMLVSVCNGAVQTFVKTSHRVLTDPNPNTKSGSSPYFAIDGSAENEDEEGSSTMIPKSRKSYQGKKERGWVNQVSSTLEVPSNRRFIIDLTGRMALETFRSFLELLVEKLFEGMKLCVNIVNEAVVDMGVDVIRYAAVKSSVIATVCLSLCLHVLDGAWILVPA